jgi:hypothetical protein
MHWAKEKEIIEALAESGCQLDAKNFNGDTALHVMTKHERLDCVLCLLTFGADVNSRGEKGLTPLHIAVKTASVLVVKALLVFEADTAVINDDGLTPWQLAKKKWNTSGVMDFNKDREGVLFALSAVGAEGAVNDPGNIICIKRLEEQKSVIQSFSPSFQLWTRTVQSWALTSTAGSWWRSTKGSGPCLTRYLPTRPRRPKLG